MLADAATEKTPAMMRAMGRAVERLGGRYIVAEDVGATVADMDEIAHRDGARLGHLGDGGRSLADDGARRVPGDAGGGAASLGRRASRGGRSR